LDFKCNLYRYTQREPDLGDVNVNVENALSTVGDTCDGGRKGALKLLSGGADVRTGKGAARGSTVEAWANASVLYLSVGQPGKGKRGVGDFWEEEGREGGDIIMRPDEASFAGVGDEVMARFAGAVTGRVRTMADLEASNAASNVSSSSDADVNVGDVEGEGEEGVSGDSLKERARLEEQTQQTALLFMRRPPGSYVFCGRLEAVDGVGDGDAGGAVGSLRLVDTAPLRTSSTFHQLIGCRLLPGAPAEEA
jgi:hypothetical protein